MFETEVTLPEKMAEPFSYVSLVNILKNPAESVKVQIDPAALRAIRGQIQGSPSKPTDKMIDAF